MGAAGRHAQELNRAPEAVAVIGAGTMGAGIALAFARGGCRDVRLIARRQASLERAADRVGDGVRMTTALASGVDGCDLAIESITEDLAAKRTVLHEVEERLPGHAVLTTNTSSLSIEELSQGLQRPDQFAGFHWLNPAELVRVVEVVSGSHTGERTVAALMSWALAMGKTPIHVRRDLPGFVVNRLQYALLREAFAVVEAGVCSYAELDAAVRNGLGARWAGVGPFETMDLAGLDVHAAVARRLYPLLSNRTDLPAVVEELVSQRALGAKTGRGVRGEYSPSQTREIAQRRDDVLRALAALTPSTPRARA